MVLRFYPSTLCLGKQVLYLVPIAPTHSIPSFFSVIVVFRRQLSSNSPVFQALNSLAFSFLHKTFSRGRLQAGPSVHIPSPNWLRSHPISRGPRPSSLPVRTQCFPGLASDPVHSDLLSLRPPRLSPSRTRALGANCSTHRAEIPVPLFPDNSIFAPERFQNGRHRPQQEEQEASSLAGVRAGET